MNLLSSSIVKTLDSTIFIISGDIVLVKSSWNILYIYPRVVVSTLGSCSIYSSAWNDSSSCVVVDDNDNILHSYTTACTFPRHVSSVHLVYPRETTMASLRVVQFHLWSALKWQRFIRTGLFALKKDTYYYGWRSDVVFTLTK